MQLPSSESGLDITYTFLIGKKNYDIVDIVNSDSTQLMKVYIKSRSPRSNVNVFLYQNSSMQGALFSTETQKQHKEFTIVLGPQMKAYKLKLVYDTVDEGSNCPLYDVRIAMKPIQDAVKEEMRCVGLNLPPTYREISKDFEMDETYAISSQFIEKYKSTDK